MLGVFDTEFSNPKAGRVYIATLKADEPSPLPVLSDEVATRRSPDLLLAPTPSGEKPSQAPEPAAAKKEQEPKGVEKTPAEKKQEKEQPPGTRPLPKGFRIDLDGIQRRMVGLTIPPGNLSLLTAAKASSITSARRSPACPGRCPASRRRSTALT